MSERTRIPIRNKSNLVCGSLGHEDVTWFSSIPLGVLEMGGLGWIFGSAAIFSSRL